MGFLLVSSGLCVAAYMGALWAVNLFVNDPTFIDAAWGMGFVMISLLCVGWAGFTLRSLLLLALVTLWGLRLSIYLYRRWVRNGPDERYVRILQRGGRNRHLTALFIFAVQGLMMWVVSFPLQSAAMASHTDVSLLNYLGLLVGVAGTLIETVADGQLSAFRADPANRDKVMDRGLWRYSRHPNYFGDALMWWGVWLLSLSSLAHLWSIVGPITMTYLQRYMSGVPLLEGRLRKTKPGYTEYAAKTPVFVPALPELTKQAVKG